MTDDSASQRSVLLVEDQAVIAMELADSFEDAEWQVVGPFATVSQAMAALDEALPDAAVLDFNVRGGTSETVALRLVEAGVPLIFLSGDRTHTEIAALRDCQVVEKPASISVLIAALSDKVSEAG